jgi:hypothetical protein
MVRTDLLDLGGERLSAGEGRRLSLEVAQEPVELAGARYLALPETVPVMLDLSRTTGGGYALRLRFSATLSGPCMRCLEPAAPLVAVDAREVDLPGGGEELDSPYVARPTARGCARSARSRCRASARSTSTSASPIRAGPSCASSIWASADRRRPATVSFGNAGVCAMMAWR